MALIWLSTEERERFAAWLEQDAEGTRGLIEQMKRLPNSTGLVHLKTEEMEAEVIVARMLRATESR